MAFKRLAHVSGISTDTYNCSVEFSSLGSTFIFVAMPQSNRNAPGSFSDSEGNTWQRSDTFAWTIPYAPGGGGGPFYTCSLVVYWCVNPITSANHVIEANTGGEMTAFGDQRFSMYAAAFSGVNQVQAQLPWDLVGVTVNRSQHATTGSEATSIQIDDELTPTEDGCLVLLSCATYEHLAGLMTVDSDMIILDQTNTQLPDYLNFGGLLAYKIQTTAEPIQPIITSPTATWAIAGAVIFRSDGLPPEEAPPDEEPPAVGADDLLSYPPKTFITKVRQLKPHPRPPFNEYRVGDSRSSFPVTFRVFEQADLRVTIDEAELDQADFTFTGNVRPFPGWDDADAILADPDFIEKNNAFPGYDGGRLTLASAVENCIVRIWGDPAPARSTDFAAGEIKQATLNRALHGLWRIDRAQHLKITHGPVLAFDGILALGEEGSGTTYSQ